MHFNNSKRSPLSPQEGWISDGRHVLLFRPSRWDRWSLPLEVTVEVTVGELLPGSTGAAAEKTTGDQPRGGPQSLERETQTGLAVDSSPMAASAHSVWLKPLSAQQERSCPLACPAQWR